MFVVVNDAEVAAAMVGRGGSTYADRPRIVMAEIAEQEDAYAQNLEDYRTILKQIRNTESSVQPSRDHKSKVRILGHHETIGQNG